MEATDFSGLVARAVAGIEEVRGCLLISRDGLTLGAYPEGGEARTRAAWDKLESVGEPERGFLVVADEVWVFARRGAYACIVVASATTKAGLLLDRMESTLRAAEESRIQSGSAQQQRTDPVRRPRTPLHREAKPEPVLEQISQVVGDESASPGSMEASAAPPAPPPVREPIVVPEAEPSSSPPDPTPPGDGEWAGGVAPSEPAPPAAPLPEPPAPEPVVSEPVAPEPIAPGPVVPEPVPQATEASVASPAESATEVVAPEPETLPPAPETSFSMPEVSAEAQEAAPTQEEEEAEAPRFARPETPTASIPAYEPPSSLLQEAGLVAESSAEATAPEVETPSLDAPSLDIDVPLADPPASVTETPSLPELPPIEEPFGEPTTEAQADAEKAEKDKEETEVDPVALAREFAQLFDEPDPQSGV